MPLRVIVDPSFRSMGEIFDDKTRARLHEVAEVVWGRDEPMPSERFAAEIATVDAVVFGGWRHESVDALPADRLLAVLEVAGGHEHPEVGYAECLARGIHIGSCAPAFGPVVAEMTLALTLAAVRGVTAADRAMGDGTERWLHDGNATNTTLFGSTVGFVGYGNIARSLHALLAPFGVRAIANDPPIDDDRLQAAGVEPVDLDTLVEAADVIQVLAAPTPDNRHLLSAELLGRLRPDQTVVITSRAHLVDFEALTALAADGRFKAGIDVFPDEPLAGDHPIRGLDNVTCTPHLAGALPAALHEIGRLVVADLDALAADKRPNGMQYLTPANANGLTQR